ncbi:bifunctional oligoribonuclease/PAP phosphatase NrnA [Candidatus Saganbacteria bacterium]|nr:bifunctional oligoribonuclease/PAP phosphatase NrnA [Candidatus Saganbacteria bacterium]
MNETFQAIKKALKSAKTALIVSHIDPDGDSIGSMNALAIFLSEMGLTVDHYSQDGVPHIYRFLPASELVKTRLEPNRRYDLLISVDASDIKRLGEKFKPREIAKLIINIDHHHDNTSYGDINYISRASSTAELVYNLIKALKFKIDKKIAENLYVALITDTGNYRYENTSVETFCMAIDLLKAGVETHSLTTRIYDTRSLSGVRVFAAALATLEVTPDHTVAWAAVTKEIMEKHNAKSEDLVGLIDQIRSIEKVEVAILFRQDADKIKVNFRSKSKVNVSEIARRFGGGGHIRAAGVTIQSDLAVVKQVVLAEVFKFMKASKYLV